MVEQYTCPVCGGRAMIKPGNWVGLADYGNVLVCLNHPKCNTYVSVHTCTMRPMGRMAGAKTRGLRKVAHDELDPLWIKHGYDRGYVYKTLAKDIGEPDTEMHISALTDRKLLLLIKAARTWRMKENAH